ncbi:hypothetical protein [Planctomycetes bacterium K23_9]|uniref:Uncharacterized protein n=1 Tax=Stieleria marina TaxID=1930275 RepID=A0A517NZJ9_9BACT|nr:hypothetical protein K239x_45700 [Planctomycetes bacterium K23_9]
MAIRSGRFTGDATQILVGNRRGLPIIDGHGGTYRIFNSGYSAFLVAIRGQPNIVLPADCSVDVRPGSGDIMIKRVPATPTTPAGDKMVEGIYEFLSEHSEVRSGRFSKVSGMFSIVSDANPNAKSVLYRVINSGNDAFKIFRLHPTAPTLVTNLKPKTSIDIELDGNGMEVELISSAKGIYFHLDQVGDVRSGRFKIGPKIPTHPDPSLDHVIINTLRNGRRDNYFRVFNSGDHSFKLHGLAAPVTITSGMSFDFKVARANDIVSVQGLNGTDEIEGSFDFVPPHV